MKIDEDFVKGVSYYIGDGRMTAPRSLSTVNQNMETIKFFLKWLKKYFGINIENIKIKIKTNKLNYNKSKLIDEFSIKLNIKKEHITSVSLKNKAKPHHKILVEVCANNSLAKKQFDNLIPRVKLKCLKNKKLATAYIKGIMAAEGSPKHHVRSGSRTIHLKMKDEEEIKYIGKLFNDVLKINSSILEVKNEEGMWLITISGIEEIKKLNDLDIFEIESRKRDKLKKIAKSYKRTQVKKGHVDDFYTEKLNYFNTKLKRKLTAPELSKLIKRDRTRTISVLRDLERKKLIKSKRKSTRGKPFEFWI